MRAIGKIFNVVPALVLLWSLQPCQAQDGGFPNKPVQIVVPFAPGGSNDLAARVLAEKLSDVLGQQVIVVNRPGATGMLGMQTVAAAAPDGYTLALPSLSAAVLAPSLSNPRPYDALQDFAPITVVAKVPEATMASAKSGITSFAQLIAVAKAEPGKLNFGSTGVGSLPHLATALLEKETGTEMVHVPYNGGAPSVGDLITGRIQVMVNDLPTYLPHIKSGAVNALALDSTQRSSLLPDVPTTAELGYPTLLAENWFGLFAPARTPPAIVAKLNRAVVAALADPGVKADLARSGEVASGQTVEEFRAFLASEQERWGEIVKTVHIQ